MMNQCIRLRKNQRQFPFEKLDPKTISLEIIGGGINQLPLELSSLINLKSLSVSNTPLTQVSFEHFCCEKLIIFKLIQTQLSCLPNFEKFVTLTHCKVSKNPLQSLPSDLFHLPSLLELDLGSNHLSSLAPSANLPQLTRLNLENNQLTTLPDWIFSLPKLNHLNVDNNPLDNSTKQRLQKDYNIWF